MLNKAGEAKEQTEIAEVKDRAQLDILDWQAGQLKNNSDATLNDDIVKEIIDGKDYISGFNEEDPDNIKVITENGYEFPISDLYDKEGENQPPAGEDEVKVGEDFTDSKGNEWVWIEVPKTAEVYKTAGLNITNFTEEEYTKIYEDLSEYSKSAQDKYYNDECGLTESQYNDLKEKMLKSIYQNEGFHIGKYETGIKEDTPRTSLKDIDNTPVIQANKYVYNYVSMEKSQRLAEQFAIGGKSSSLLFVLQWELVEKYIETKNPEFGDNNQTTSYKLDDQSSSWGNYLNSEFMITNENAKYSINDGETYEQISEEGHNKAKGSKEILTTGATDRNSVLGIYDLAGNIFERTLQITNAPGQSYYDRGRMFGGAYTKNGDEASMSSYWYDAGASSGQEDIGFRVALY